MLCSNSSMVGRNSLLPVGRAPEFLFRATQHNQSDPKLYFLMNCECPECLKV
jgi:hypothetical protein